MTVIELCHLKKEDGDDDDDDDEQPDENVVFHNSGFRSVEVFYLGSVLDHIGFLWSAEWGPPVFPEETES